ncbi:hypothetical protein MIR68_001032 [Amoeboaphelidium protococcarum]|nr:hypothetical protein MIR68_001032 [Amoeboaphelidium protococcarum]
MTDVRNRKKSPGVIDEDVDDHINTHQNREMKALLSGSAFKSAAYLNISQEERPLPIVFVYLLLFIIALMTSAVRTTLPEALMSVSDQFGALNAMLHLRNITEFQHPWGSNANIKVGQYIVEQLHNLKQQANVNGYSLQIEVDDDQMDYQGLYFVPSSSITIEIPYKRAFVRSPQNWLVEPRNIYALLSVGSGGQQSPQNNTLRKCILVTGHFDSAVSSYGAYDDGMSMAQMLEIIRALIDTNAQSLSQPWKYDILFMFGDGEEVGLLDAFMFTSSKWYNRTAMFINMEAGGNGRRPMMFRYNDLNLKLRAASVLPYPHMDVIGSEAFKLGLVPSDTNYRVFVDNAKLPGLDFAFYENRYKYHTHMDEFSDVNPKTVQLFGGNILALIKHLLYSDYTPQKNSKGKYYDSFYVVFDFMGKSVVQIGFGGYVALIVIFVATASAYLYFLRGYGEGTTEQSSSNGQSLKQSFKNVGWLFLHFFLSLIGTLIVFYVVQFFNPAYIGTKFLTCFAMLLIMMHAILFVMKDHIAKDSLVIDNSVLLIYYSIWSVFALILALFGSGVLYLMVFWLIFVCCEAYIRKVAIYYLAKSDQKQEIGVAANVFLILVRMTIPIMMTWDAFEVLYEGLAPVVLDGSTPFMSFVLAFLFCTLFFVPFTPELLQAYQFSKSWKYASITLTAILLLVCTVQFPYSDWRAVRMRPWLTERMTEGQNQSSGVNVTMYGGYDVLYSLKRSQFASKYQFTCGYIDLLMQFDPAKDLHLESCWFMMQNRSLVPSVDKEVLGVSVSSFNASQISGVFSAPAGSYSCEMVMRFDKGSIVTAKFEPMEKSVVQLPGLNILTLMALRKNAQQDWQLPFTVQIKSQDWNQMNFTATCYYDDLVHQVPLVDEVMKEFPDWVTEFTLGERTAALMKNSILQREP